MLPYLTSLDSVLTEYTRRNPTRWPERDADAVEANLEGEGVEGPRPRGESVDEGWPPGPQRREGWRKQGGAHEPDHREFFDQVRH